MKNIPHQEDWSTIGPWVTHAMNEKGLTMREMAKKLAITYEHVRRIARGESVPSRLLLKPMCELLGMDYEHAESLTQAQKMERMYGAVKVEFIPQNMKELFSVWRDLSDSQQEDAMSMMQGWAKNNQRVRQAG